MKIIPPPKYPDQRQILHTLRRLLRALLPPGQYQVFLFGSRATRTGNELSDFDIGILGKKPLPPLLRFRIENEIENLPYLYKFDLVDFARVSEDFKKTALSNIIPISL